MSRTRTAEPINLSFGLWTRVGRRKRMFNRICQVAPMCPQYQWIVHVQQRCGLLSNYFDHLSPLCLQCFDTVGWAAGRVSGLLKSCGGVLEWWSVWSKVQMICIWPSWCHCHPIISCSSTIQNGLPFWCLLTQVVLEKRPLNGCSSCFLCEGHTLNIHAVQTACVKSAGMLVVYCST